MHFTIYADGGARGNPGPAGAGAVVRDEQGKTISEVSEFLGHATNNVAEYTAIVRALEQLTDILKDKAGEASVTINMDSMLVVKQMTGEWKLKHPGLKPLAARVKEMCALFHTVTFNHVYREKNKDADALANRAMDLGR
ncbi:MAG: bifunctional RNase H/acid phosphatase [Parcubacteria group bacterium]|nr:bifunctional RNase H/acid phosphatase [Parcubacteria group bacterium]